jgi:arsenite/tail-anchored protein-transporting ATPase
VQRTTANVPDEVRQLLARLRDPEFARILVVTLAESTPVDEADRLQSDLQRAGIQPFGWVVNASLANSQSKQPTLRARAAAEIAQIDRVRQLSERAIWFVRWQPRTPVGIGALRALAEGIPVGGASALAIAS